MIGTAIWRLKEAFAVLRGEKKTVPKKRESAFSEKNILDLEPYVIEDQTLKNYLSTVSIEFCFSEFGASRKNAGGSTFSGDRLEPTLSTLRKYFPDAKYTVYSDIDLEIPGVGLKKITSLPIPEPENPRYFYRVADYFKFKSLVESTSDFTCVVDSDMFVVSEEIYRLVYLSERFGFCAPYNPRNLMKTDMQNSLDVGEIDDLSNGFGHSYNQSPMTIWKKDPKGMKFFEKCCEIMQKEPSRASLVMWKAANETGYSPYLLPPQWCVCAEDIGIGNEVLLHVGHPAVAEFYNVKL